MIRTQIQLPDRLYRGLKLLAEKEETSLADIIRRAGEYMIRIHPEINKTARKWEPPEPENLGIQKNIHVSEWRRLASELPVADALPGRKVRS